MNKADAPTESLILLARPPTPGRVKTRLIPALGAEVAARLYLAFLADAAALAAAVREARPSTGLTAEWATENTPAGALSPEAPTLEALPLETLPLEAMPLATWLPGPFLHRAQRGRDLGQRMAAALGRRLAAGDRTGRADRPRRAVLMGTDFPDIPAKIVLNAFAALEEMERASLGSPCAVLGPARDGGYYLIGLNRLSPGIFAEMEWGGPGVFRAQKERLESSGHRVHILPEWSDVDTTGDLERLRARLECHAGGQGTAAPNTWKALDEI